MFDGIEMMDQGVIDMIDMVMMSDQMLRYMAVEMTTE